MKIKYKLKNKNLKVINKINVLRFMMGTQSIIHKAAISMANLVMVRNLINTIVKK